MIERCRGCLNNGARGGPAQRTVTSTDEQLTVTGSPRIAPGLENGFLVTV